MKTVQLVQVGDVVRVQRSTSRARGTVVEVLGGDPQTFKLRTFNGKVKQYDAIHVVEVVEHAKPVVPVVVPVAAPDPVVPTVTVGEAKVVGVVTRGGVRPNSMLGMALQELASVGGPLHVKVLTEAVLARGFTSTGKTPQATLAAHLLTAEKKGLVTKVAPATFALVAGVVS